MWKRDFYESTDQKANLLFLCFYDGEAILELDRTRDGPVHHPDELRVVTCQDPRETLPDLLGLDILDGAYEESLDPKVRERVLKAGGALMVGATIEDPSHLQMLWLANAFVRAAAFCGAFQCLDLGARRWWSAEELKAWSYDRPFRIHEHITISAALEAKVPHIRTHGMEKFARPDLVIPSPSQRDVHAAGTLLAEVAYRLSQGKTFEHDSLVRLELANGPIETRFLCTDEQENAVFGTTNALVLVDPLPGETPADLKKRGCPVALAQLGDAEPDLPTEAPRSSPLQQGTPLSFLELVDGLRQLAGVIETQSPELLGLLTGRPWKGPEPTSDMRARLALESLAEGEAGSLSLPADWSDFETVLAVGGARVVLDETGLNVDLASTPSSVRMLYESTFCFEQRFELADLLGCDPEEAWVSARALGFWLYYGYHGELPQDIDTVRRCAGFGRFFRSSVGERSAVEVSLEAIVVACSLSWDSILKECPRQELVAFLGPLTQDSGQENEEPAAGLVRQAFLRGASMFEGLSGLSRELPPPGHFTELHIDGESFRLSQFRILVGAFCAQALCNIESLSFPVENAHPDLVTAYGAAVAFAATKPLPPERQLPDGINHHAMVAAMGFVYLFQDSLPQEATDLICKVATIWTICAQEVRDMLSSGG